MTARSRADLRDTALLVAPSIISAIGFYWMSSGRWRALDSSTCVKFLLFIPWQTLGVTIVKCGVDTWVLSRGESWKGRSLTLNNLVIRRYVPLSLAVGLLLLTRLSLFACALVSLTAITDAVALVLSNEMSSHGRVALAASANFLKYPLFFSATGILAIFWPTNFRSLLVVFGLASAARLSVLLFLRPRSATSGEQPNTIGLAAQQILNYGLFKNDQLLTGIVNRAGDGANALFVYLARFPELVAAVLTACAPLLLPRLYAGTGVSNLWAAIKGTKSALGITVIIVAAIAYGVTAAKPMADEVWPLLPAVVMHALLVLPVNYRTYALFRERQERSLLSGLVKGNLTGIGIAIIIATLFNGVPPAILWIVPVQQSVFLWSTRHVNERTDERNHAANVAPDT